LNRPSKNSATSLRPHQGRVLAEPEDSKGQQGITNLEVSGRFAAHGLGRETAGLGFHTAEAAVCAWS
jgi:hypothetical protein